MTSTTKKTRRPAGVLRFCVTTKKGHEIYYYIAKTRDSSLSVVKEFRHSPAGFAKKPSRGMSRLTAALDY